MSLANRVRFFWQTVPGLWEAERHHAQWMANLELYRLRETTQLLRENRENERSHVRELLDLVRGQPLPASTPPLARPSVTTTEEPVRKRGRRRAGCITDLQISPRHPTPTPSRDCWGAVDPAYAWRRFESVFPVLAVYRAWWNPLTPVAQAVTPEIQQTVPPPPWSVSDLQHRLHWPSELETEGVTVAFVARAMAQHSRGVPGGAAAAQPPPSATAEMFGLEHLLQLRWAGCLVHGFQIGPRRSVAVIREALSLPHRVILSGTSPASTPMF